MENGEMYEKVIYLRVFSKSRSTLVKNHWFFYKIVISRVWERRGNRQTDKPTNARINRLGGGWWWWEEEGQFQDFG